MNFFMLSKCGEGAGLMLRLQEEGHDCSIKIKEKDYQDVYDGLLVKEEEPDEGAMIIVDSSGLGTESDAYKRRGFRVFGGSKFADRLEQDREYGFQFMNDHNIQTPKTENFWSFNDGIKYAKSRDEKLVFKPSGSLPCKLTYCSESVEDLINYMRFVEKYFGKEIDDFVLQDFIEGEVVSTEFWVGPNGFIHPANHTVEVKKFLNDNLGPSTGCQGNLVWIAEDDKIVEALLRTQESLVKKGYLGPIDLNCVVNESGIYGLEWTPRFGLDAMPTLLQMIPNVGELISGIINGTVHEMNSLASEFAAGVRITIPPYPSEPKSSKSLEKQVPSKGVPVNCLLDVKDKAYLYEVMYDKDGQLVHSDGTGVLAVISDISDNVENCCDSIYDILEELKIPDKQYRTDLDVVLPEMYQKTMEVL